MPHGSAARLSGKRLLALWNALPGVETQTKVGDRDTLIDQLWSAIEALPDPDQPSDTKRPSKQEAVIAMLQRPEGATVDEVASMMGWQRHTVRRLFSGTLKKSKLRPPAIAEQRVSLGSKDATHDPAAIEGCSVAHRARIDHDLRDAGFRQRRDREFVLSG